MSLQKLIKEGWFDEDPYDYNFDANKLTEKEWLALTLNGRVRLASKEDSRIYDIKVVSKDKVEIEILSVHTKQTAAMAGYTEDEFLKVMSVDIIKDETLLIKTLKDKKQTRPWWKFWGKNERA